MTTCFTVLPFVLFRVIYNGEQFKPCYQQVYLANDHYTEENLDKIC